MSRYCLTIACVACISALAPEKHEPLDTAAACTAEDAESSLLQTTLVRVDTLGEAARIDTNEDSADAPDPKTPSDAEFKLAKMSTEGTASQDVSGDNPSTPIRQLALLMENLSPRSLHKRMHPRGPVAKERPPGFFSLPGGVFVAFLVICFFLARRKRKQAAQLNAATTTSVTPDRKAPRATRRAFNLMTGAWEEVEEASPPEDAIAQTPRKVSSGNSRVRARSSTIDVQRACARGTERDSCAQTLETPGDARGIVGFVVSHGLVIPHAPCGALSALRAVREVLTAAGGEQPLQLEKADLLTRGVTPQCFELLRAAGLKDVGRGLVLAEGSGPKLSSVLTAVEAALSPSKLEPLPTVQAVSDAYGSYAEEEVFTYN